MDNVNITLNCDDNLAVKGNSLPFFLIRSLLVWISMDNYVGIRDNQSEANNPYIHYYPHIYTF